MSAPWYAITGIHGQTRPGDNVPIRRELDEWYFSKDINDVNQKTLFILALQRFQARGLDPDKNDDLSYLDVAGEVLSYGHRKFSG